MHALQVMPGPLLILGKILLNSIPQICECVSYEIQSVNCIPFYFHRLNGITADILRLELKQIYLVFTV
jgi:hypothetical protein